MGEKWEKKYMEREGNEYFSLSFHILFFPFFPWGKMGKHTFFHGQKWGWNPPHIIIYRYNYIHYIGYNKIKAISSVTQAVIKVDHH